MKNNRFVAVAVDGDVKVYRWAVSRFIDKPAMNRVLGQIASNHEEAQVAVQ